ncbi:MAG: T9SS type A sorting domain-containing protein [Chitinophagaceae bacterium]
MNFCSTAKTLGLTLMFTLLVSITYSQTLLNSTGSTISGDGYVIEYSVGEISITAILGQNYYVSQGLLQPNVKIPFAGCSYINDEFQYFPNPVKTIVSLAGVYNWIDSYMIYAADGKLVGNAPFINNTIDMSRLASGIYFVQLFPGCNGKYKTIKIAKQ